MLHFVGLPLSASESAGSSTSLETELRVKKERDLSDPGLTGSVGDLATAGFAGA